MIPHDELIFIIIYAASAISKEVREWMRYRQSNKNTGEKPRIPLGKSISVFQTN